MANLYESDFFAWTQDQATRLKQAAAKRVNIDLDWKNLAEEIESMGGSERHEINNRLIELLFHLAKLAWSPDLPPRAVAGASPNSTPCNSSSSLAPNARSWK